MVNTLKSNYLKNREKMILSSWNLYIWNQKIDDYLWITQQEKQYLKQYYDDWYCVIWERGDWDDYPEYVKNFIENNKDIIVNWDEIIVPRLNNDNIKSYSNFILIKIKQNLNLEEIEKKYMPDFKEYRDNIIKILTSNTKNKWK